MVADKELFTERVSAGNRTFFFDVRESIKGSKYLVISESRKERGTYVHSRVMIFPENLEAFVKGFHKALRFLNVAKTRAASHSIENIRQKYPKAYTRWSPEEDQQLILNHQSGMSVVALAQLFLRQPSAIRSRLVKLGLLPRRTRSPRRGKK
jgi:hypothetical protein